MTERPRCSTHIEATILPMSKAPRVLLITEAGIKAEIADIEPQTQGRKRRERVSEISSVWPRWCAVRLLECRAAIAGFEAHRLHPETGLEGDVMR